MNYDQFFLIMFRDASFSAICFFKQKNLRCQFSESQSQICHATAGHQPAWTVRNFKWSPWTGPISVHWLMMLTNGCWFVMGFSYVFASSLSQKCLILTVVEPWRSDGFRGRNGFFLPDPRRLRLLDTWYRSSGEAATPMKITSPTSPTKSDFSN